MPVKKKSLIFTIWTGSTGLTGLTGLTGSTGKRAKLANRLNRQTINYGVIYAGSKKLNGFL
jgi:hypothetical protein